MSTDSATEPNHYDLLGISINATPDEIRAAYRRTIIRVHPDRNRSPDAHQTTTNVNLAYSVLKDPIKRSRYDRTVRASNQTQEEFRYHRPRYREPKAEESRSERERERREEREERAEKDRRRKREKEPVTIESAGILWQKAQTRNGWVVRLARATAWVGERKDGYIACAFFTHERWQEHTASTEDAESLTKVAEKAVRNCHNKIEAVAAVSKTINTASEYGNRAAGVRCSNCKRNYHDHAFESCFPCYEKDQKARRNRAKENRYSRYYEEDDFDEDDLDEDDDLEPDDYDFG